MEISRVYNISKLLEPNKVLVILGPRQVGKTTLVKDFLSKTKLKYRFENGGDLDLHDWLGSLRLSNLRKNLSGYDLLVVDEAQKVPNIGEALKLIVDSFEGINVVVTGSASFELAGQVGEPLVGRMKDLRLYPIAQLEFAKMYSLGELEQQLADFMIYGSYPEILIAKNIEEKIFKIETLVNSYLLKDILEFEKVKDSKLLRKLLSLLAFQIGKEVSLNELANNLDINIRTVDRYLDLLEKSFIIYNVRGFSKNLRKEVVKTSRYYFYDNGVRNALISNFNSFDKRNDIGQLWENFLFMERLKKRTYNRIYANTYFWRTWDQKEIDLIEERGGELFGYEFKWGDKKPKPPKGWLETYSNAKYKVINRTNYLKFVI
ncbi:MAG TPA: ATP-binding protein [Candidatus Portnoybacteria bacterium]|nr:ATP-binding protein [Candidatus Portnoybacteria bacterium]